MKYFAESLNVRTTDHQVGTNEFVQQSSNQRRRTMVAGRQRHNNVAAGGGQTGTQGSTQAAGRRQPQQPHGLRAGHRRLQRTKRVRPRSIVDDDQLVVRRGIVQGSTDLRDLRCNHFSRITLRNQNGNSGHP